MKSTGEFLQFFWLKRTLDKSTWFQTWLDSRPSVVRGIQLMKVSKVGLFFYRVRLFFCSRLIFSQLVHNDGLQLNTMNNVRFLLIRDKCSGGCFWNLSLTYQNLHYKKTFLNWILHTTKGRESSHVFQHSKNVVIKQNVPLIIVLLKILTEN